MSDVGAKRAQVCRSADDRMSIQRKKELLGLDNIDITRDYKKK